MELWDRIIRGCALVGDAVVGIFGEWNALLTVLVVVMSLDYISGVIVGAAGRSLKTEGGGLDSKTGFVGLAKKGLIVVMVLLATMLDRALGTDAMVFQTATTCYYIANEGISCVENAGLMGLPVPAAVKKALEQMREKHNSKSEYQDRNIAPTSATSARASEVTAMPQYDRDRDYLVALGIFRNLHRNGVVSESEVVQIASFLAERFSPSLAATTPEIA